MSQYQKGGIVSGNISAGKISLSSTPETVGGKPKHRLYIEDADNFPKDVKSQISSDKL